MDSRRSTTSTGKESVLFARPPLATADGIDVFLPNVDATDEYKAGNPYRPSTAVKESTWDRYRISTILASVVGPSVLDLGSGEGELTAELAKMHLVEGLDYSISAVRLARELVPHAHFVVGDAIDLPYADGQFDSVVMGNLFEHVESPCKLLREAHRVLRVDGRLVVSTPSRYKTGSFRRALTGRPIILNSTHHVTEYTCGQVREIMNWCGFEVISSRSNLKCQTIHGRAFAYVMQGIARLLGSHTEFGDPCIYVARRR